jgi:CRISPR-associated protein Csb2
MTVLELSFPAGRYHATPWGRHVNEGAVEWPPSPWRIVRALIATWYLKAREIPEGTIRALTDSLSQPPVFHLPCAATAHTRHYMPYNEGKNEKTTKVFDTFIQLAEKDVVLVAWDVTLPPDQLNALKMLASRLGYFGRAESLVIASVLDDVAAIEPNASPINEDAALPEKTELVHLLAPTSPTAYAAWRNDFMTNAEAALGSKPTPTQKKKLPHVPDDLFAALQADTGELQAAGWNMPPGAAHLKYTRQEDAFAPATRPGSHWKKLLPTVARFSLTSVAPPSITRALAVGEQVHTVLCKQSEGHPIFTGLGSDAHKHSHIFSESVDDNDAHITHVTVFAPRGFDSKAVEALRSIGWTWGFNKHELRLVLQGIGKPADFPDCKLFAFSKKWVSQTPFVSTRHAKTYRDGRPKIDENGWQTGSAPHDLLRLLEENAEGAAEKINMLKEKNMPFEFGQRRFRSLQFLTRRGGGKGSRGDGSGNAFTIVFKKPVNGPIAVGYGAHFGLGLFVPVAD